MASTASLLQALYLVRSRKPFDTGQFENIILGAATAQRLSHVMGQRQSGLIPSGSIFDSRYQDFLAEPVEQIKRIYDYFDIEFSYKVEESILRYIKQNPQHQHGEHRYTISEGLIQNRELFESYQREYRVPSEI